MNTQTVKKPEKSFLKNVIQKWRQYVAIAASA
jgi:hypothetical protein